MVGLRRLRVGLGAVGLVAAGLGWASEGVADSFYLKTGEVVEGSVLQATRNTVTLRAGGIIRPTSLQQIDKVVLQLADGSELSGEFLTWRDGVFEIRSAGLLMHVKDGKVIEETTDVASHSEASPAPQPGSPKPAPSPKIAMQGLPELTLKDGQVLIGRIIHATGSIVTLRRHAGGVVPTSRAQIALVRFVGEDGEVVSGQFVDWQDGVYHLQTENSEVLASLSDEAANAGPPQALFTQSITPQSFEEPVVPAIDSIDAAASPNLAIGDDAAGSSNAAQQDVAEKTAKGSELDDKTGAGGPVSETAVAGLAGPKAALTGPSAEQPADAPQNSPHLIHPTVAAVDEDGEVVFEFHLDHPADRPLVILYAATDDTAKAGQDFEAKSGVITFSAGSEYAEVRVPLIDDEQSETSEQFHLFLSGDPETVQFSQRQIAATINDND